MYDEDRQQLDRKREAARLGAVNQCSTPTMAQGDYSPKPLRRTPMRERAYQAIADAERLNRRATAAQRALSIIEQHHEFAELLDLLNEF